MNPTGRREARARYKDLKQRWDRTGQEGGRQEWEHWSQASEFTAEIVELLQQGQLPAGSEEGFIAFLLGAL